MLLSLIEQKSFGVYQGDFKPENMIFNGSICFLVDYDQAQRDTSFAEMRNIQFIDWIAQDFQKRRGQDFFTQRDRKFDKADWLDHFWRDSFDLSRTSVLAKQVTTNTQSGIYHSLDFPQVHCNGARDISARKRTLDLIDFKENEKLLDVGCNLGLLSHYLNDRGCTVTGIDMDRDAVLAAKTVANIAGKDIAFKMCDMSRASINEFFDTICLFSVLHHIDGLRHAGKFISRHCRRIILESRLNEGGSVPAGGKWKRTNTWRFSNIGELSSYIEKLILGFRLEKVWGQVDRNRYILTFLKK